MLHKAWNSKGEMPYCFPRSSIKFQGHTVQNITNFDPNWAFRTICWLQLSNPSDLPCSRSSVKFQGCTAPKIIAFDPNWAFRDCNSSSNSPMGTKWYTKLEVEQKMCPSVLQGHPSNFKVTQDKKIADFDPNWAFPDCNSNLNSPMDLKWCTKLGVI